MMLSSKVVAFLSQEPGNKDNGAIHSLQACKTNKQVLSSLESLDEAMDHQSA